MDKSTGKELVINGETITATTTFIPTEPSGIATVEFTFDSKYITEDTDIVAFENLYKDGKELAVHPAASCCCCSFLLLNSFTVTRVQMPPDPNMFQTPRQL